MSNCLCVEFVAPGASEVGWGRFDAGAAFADTLREKGNTVHWYRIDISKHGVVPMRRMLINSAPHKHGRRPIYDKVYVIGHGLPGLPLITLYSLADVVSCIVACSGGFAIVATFTLIVCGSASPTPDDDGPLGPPIAAQSMQAAVHHPIVYGPSLAELFLRQIRPFVSSPLVVAYTGLIGLTRLRAEVHEDLYGVPGRLKTGQRNVVLHDRLERIRDVPRTKFLYFYDDFGQVCAQSL